MNNARLQRSNINPSGKKVAVSIKNPLMLTAVPYMIWRKALLVPLFMLFLSTAAFATELSEEHRGVYEMQALFLYNFANFVEWPDRAFPDNNAPVKLCLYGGVPLDTFVRVFHGTLIRDRQLVITQTDYLEDIKTGCQILFVGFDKHEEITKLLSDVRHIFVLSVSSIADFAEQGGVINITRTADQMQIVVNLEAALRSGLYISSDLLSIARVLE